MTGGCRAAYGADVENRPGTRWPGQEIWPGGWPLGRRRWPGGAWDRSGHPRHGSGRAGFGRPDGSAPWSGWRWFRGGPPLLLLPAVLVAIQVVGVFVVARRQPDQTPLDVLGVALAFAGPAALLLRRRHPVVALVLASVSAAVYYLLGYPIGPVFLAPLFALGAAVKAGRRGEAWVFAGVGYAGFVALELTVGRPPRIAAYQLVSFAAWTLVVLVASEAARIGRERAAEAYRSRQEADRRRVSDERLRIARELHDVLAHHISLIHVQAGVALHLLDSGTSGGTGSDPAAAGSPGPADTPLPVRSALVAIKRASKDALVELRSTLGVLRQVDEAAPRQPSPGLARLDDLAARFAAAGTQVRTEVDGSPRALPARVDLAAFRIVQEALTNVSRHAGGAPAVVRIAYGPDDLTVRVDDEGPDELRGDHGDPGDRGDPVPGGGNGIPGMRERAEALGGVFLAGPRADGGFRVQASFPLDGLS